MYVRISNQSYRNVPFANACSPNYVYSSVTDLAKLQVPESSLEELAWCRSIGILQSFHGKLYICDINSTGGTAPDIRIQISVVYLKSPQSLAMITSLVMPCPVQIFGSMQWHGRKPIIYVKTMQVLSVPKAIQMKDIMDRLKPFKSHKPRQAMS